MGQGAKAGRTSSQFVPPREEVPGLARPDDERQPTHEEDLRVQRELVRRVRACEAQLKGERGRTLPRAMRAPSKSMMTPRSMKKAPKDVRPTCCACRSVHRERARACRGEMGKRGGGERGERQLALFVEGPTHAHWPLQRYCDDPSPSTAGPAEQEQDRDLIVVEEHSRRFLRGQASAGGSEQGCRTVRAHSESLSATWRV